MHVFHSGCGQGLPQACSSISPACTLGFCVLREVLAPLPNAPCHHLHLVNSCRVCEGPTQVMGMPYYNSMAILGGFAGPYLTGALLQRPNGLATVCIVIGVLMVAAAGALVLLRHLMMRRDRLRAVQDIYVDAHATFEASDGVGAKDIEALGNIRKDSGPDLGVHQATDSLRGLDGRDAMLRRKDCTRKMLPPSS